MYRSTRVLKVIREKEKGIVAAAKVFILERPAAWSELNTIEVLVWDLLELEEALAEAEKEELYEYRLKLKRE